MAFAAVSDAGEELCSTSQVENPPFRKENPMKKAVLAFALVAVLGTPSFAQSVGEKTGVNSALGIAPKTEDFIRKPP
jgi:hypothetical protein